MKLTALSFNQITTRSLLTVSGITTVAICAFVIWPASREMIEVRNQLTAIQDDLENKRITSESFSQLLEEYKQYTPQQRQLLTQAIMPRARKLELVTALENAAAEASVQQDLEIGAYEQVAKSPFFSLPLTLNIEGSYQGLTAYLQTLERLPYYVIVERLTISRPGQLQPETASTTAIQSEKLQALIQARTFWQ